MGCCGKLCGWGYLSLIVSYFTLVFVYAPWDQTSTVSLAPGQVGLINPDTTWFESVDIFSRQSIPSGTGPGLPVSNLTNFTAYLFAHRPPKTTVVKRGSLAANMLVSSQPAVESLYINSGSNVSLSFTANGSLDFCLIEGYKKYKKYSDNGESSLCLLHSTGNSLLYQLNTTSSTMYYFIWKAQPPVLLSAANYTGFFRQYSTAPSQDMRRNCTRAWAPAHCSFPLDRGSSQVVLISLPNDPNVKISKFKININGRLGFYLPVFICSAWGVLCLLSLSIICVNLIKNH